MPSWLVDKSNKIFQSLSKKKYVLEKELKYFIKNFTYNDNEESKDYKYLLFA